MQKNLTKIVIILGLIIINLFYCFLFNSVYAADTIKLPNGYYGLDEMSDSKLRKLLDGKIDTKFTLDYLAYGARTMSSAYFEFDAQNMLNQQKFVSVDDKTAADYGTMDTIGVACVSSQDHDYARTQRIDCIIDINEEGVTSYRPNAKPKTISRDTKNSDEKKLLEYCDQLAYFSYVSVHVGEGKSEYRTYKSLIRFSIIGSHYREFRNILGVPDALMPHTNGNDITDNFYKEVLDSKDYKTCMDKYRYSARVVFCNGQLKFSQGQSQNGQNDIIFSGQQKTKTSLRIKKVDPDGKPLKGVQIRIYKSSKKEEKGDWLYSGLTNEDGLLNFSGQKGEWYYVREYKTITGYIKANPDFKVEKLIEDKQPVKFINQKATELTIVKEDQDGNNVKGLKFKIYRVEDGKKTFIDNFTTSEKGEINYKKAKVGETYYIEEDIEYAKKKGYQPDGTQTSMTVTIKPGENKFTFTNKLTRPKLTIIKQDSGTEKLLPGATFEIYDEKGNLIATETTEDGGKVSILIGEEGIGKTYRVREVDPPPKYKPSNEGDKLVPLNVGENIVTFKNEPKIKPGGNPDVPGPIHTPADGEYTIKIRKVDDDDVNLEKVGFKFTAQIEVSEFDRQESQSVSCTHYKQWWYDENNNPVWDGLGYPEYDAYGNMIGLREHANDTKQINKYKNETYDFYLDSSGKWVKGSEENAHVYYTDSKGVIDLSGKMPITKQEKINTNGDSKEVAGKFVGKIKAIEVKNPNYGYKGQGKLTYGLSNGESKTVPNTPELQNINIHKIDLEDETYDLSGVEFKVSLTSNGNSYKKKYIQLTDASGHVYSGEKVGSSATIDKYNKANGNKYHVEYVDDIDQASIFVTSKNGKISIKNVEVYAGENDKYEYELREITNTNYGYKQEVGNQYEVITKEGGSTKVENEQEIGNLVIHKRDQRVWEAYEQEVGLEDVEFKIRISEPGYLQLSDSNGVVKEIKGKAVIDEHNETAEDGRYIVKYVSSKEEATTFITDENGIIRIENLEVWKNPDEPYTYYMDETAMGEKWELYYDVKTEDEAKNDNTTLEDDEDIDKPIDNYQRYVDLSGYVWEDIQSGKDKMRNDLYKDDENDYADKRVNKDDLSDGKKGITVNLVKSGKVLASCETSEGEGEEAGNYFFPAQMKNVDTAKYPDIKRVDSNGYKIVIDELKEYSIEFWYNGLKYASVDLPDNLSEYWEKPNSSKAKDNKDSRDNINESFYSIKGEEDRDDDSGTKGFTGNNTKLTYTNGEYSSALVQNTKYTKESLKGSVDPEENATVMASTRDSGFEIKFIPEREKVRTTIENLNLGIYLRQQADLAIATDLDNMKMTINGYTHTYNYNKRSRQIDGEEALSGENHVMNAFSVQAKNQCDSTYRKLSYVREIYPSYLAHSEAEGVDENDKLKISVTYRIVIRNESSHLINKVNIKNYYDPNYEKPSISIGEELIHNDNDTENDFTSGEKAHTCKSLNEEFEIQPKSNLEIRLTYNVNYKNVMELIKGEDGWKTVKNTTEIISYSTYDKYGNKYASIDKDSAPNNSVYGKDTTYEDDIDSAPDLIIKKSPKDKKLLRGTVFEDKATKLESSEYIGNGEKETNEKSVKDVRVQLIDTKTGESAKLYTLDDAGRYHVGDAEARTKENEKYEFDGLVPGIYYLKYTYGTGEDEDGEQIETKIEEREITPQDYKSTIVKDDNVRTLFGKQTDSSLNHDDIDNEQNYWKYIAEDINIPGVKNKDNDDAYWYEDEKYKTYSASIDNYVRRLYINNKLNNFGYIRKSGYDAGRVGANAEKLDDDDKLYIMASQTPLMCIAIEERDDQTVDTNIELETDKFGHKIKSEYETTFGIVERPRQDFNVTKEISYVKVTLANGQILLEGNPRINQSIGSYLTYPEGGMVKIEIDNEILQGAKLEVIYEIKVENNSDVVYDEMQYYDFGIHTGEPVKTKVQLMDYMDKEISYFKEDNWKQVETSRAEIDKLDLSENTKKLEFYNYICEREQNDSDAIAPGKTKIVYITANKLLTTAKEMWYDNKVEIYNVKNSVGRFYENGTPGNNEEENAEKERDNNKDPIKAIRAELTIVPPTGQTRIYYAIGISCLVLLVVGIVLIKKKVLK